MTSRLHIDFITGAIYIPCYTYLPISCFPSIDALCMYALPISVNSLETKDKCPIVYTVALGGIFWVPLSSFASSMGFSGTERSWCAIKGKI